MIQENIWRKIKMSITRVYASFIVRIRRVQKLTYTWHNSYLENLHKLTTVFIIVLILFGSFIYIEFFRPDQKFPHEHYSTIKNGDNLRSIAKQLKSENIISNTYALEIAVRIMGGNHSIHSGDYLFSHPIGTWLIARIITTGEYGLKPIRITIPEGSTVIEMADIYQKYLFKFNAQNFIKQATPYEGYLYPDTYYFLPNVREDEIINTMNDTFKKNIEAFSAQIEASSYTFNEIITLASILQKEAWKPKDQKLIAGVLYNRLKKNMKLQVDATFTYTHNKGTSQITLDDLADKNNPYNTYVHTGLPPGPISAPGHNALDAAVNPTKSKYYFYLADHHGNTYYSITYAQHLAKKRRYVD